MKYFCPLLITALALGACSCSFSLIGGRHINQNFDGSDDNTANPSMQAPSQTTFSDMIKELYPSPPTLPPTLPPTPEPGSPVVPEVEDNDTDVVPEEPPVEEYTGQDTETLTKPAGDPDASGAGKLVLLLAAKYTAAAVDIYSGATVAGEPLEAGRYTKRSNDNRQTWRFGKPGGAYGSTATYRITFEDGPHKDLTVHPGQRQKFDEDFKHLDG